MATKNYRNGEAKIIRNDEANNLPVNARVLTWRLQRG